MLGRHSISVVCSVGPILASEVCPVLLLSVNANVLLNKSLWNMLYCGLSYCGVSYCGIKCLV